MLKKIKHGVGATLMMTGLMAMDSPSLLIPTILFFVGIWMLREVWLWEEQ